MAQTFTQTGVDYSWSHPRPDAVRRAGHRFAMRYVSPDASKNLSLSERNLLWAQGIAVGVVWESRAERPLDGHAAGAADARAANGLVSDLGLAGIPIYFAVDWDAKEGQQGVINDYFRGAAKIIGEPRTGVYAGYWPLKRLFDAGLIRYGWQTYAWSGGNLDPRAHIYQYKNGVSLGGGQVDLNRAVRDCGLRGSDVLTKVERKMVDRRCWHRSRHTHLERGTDSWRKHMRWARWWKARIRARMALLQTLARAERNGWKRYHRGQRYQLLRKYWTGEACK